MSVARVYVVIHRHFSSTVASCDVKSVFASLDRAQEYIIKELGDLEFASMLFNEDQNRADDWIDHHYKTLLERTVRENLTDEYIIQRMDVKA